MKWKTNKKGKRINQSHNLEHHVMIEHEDEYEKIMEAINETMLAKKSMVF